MRSRVLFVACVVLALAGPARADVKPHALFSDGMVLQQKMKVPVWGLADNDEKVTVVFQGQEVSATAKHGRWQVTLSALKAGGPFELTIAGKNTVTIKNVLVGEVWVCSGQSNMEWPLNAAANGPEAIAASKNPMIHLFNVQKATPEKPVASVNGAWTECGPGAVDSFSAVAYFFGRDLQKELNVPVGLIETAWGGTRAEAWMSRATLESLPETQHEFKQLAEQTANYPKALEKYEAELKSYEEAAAKAKADNKEPPRKPQKPGNPHQNPNAPSALYNGMIAPLLPYAIKGAIWYQGESNAGQAGKYEAIFSAMIRNWREDWGQGDFPFLLVQLAPFMKIEKQPTDPAWARLREAQLLTSMHLPRVGMAVITDVGDEKDIHPRRKEPVGHRLALAALSIAYGKKEIYPGPTYDNMKVEGNRTILRFHGLGGGLVAKDGPLQGFTVAGEDHVFHNAEARIEDNAVIVTCEEVARPVAVRYGWANYPLGNLWNKLDLPATPFRTDRWPVESGPRKTGP